MNFKEVTCNAGHFFCRVHLAAAVSKGFKFLSVRLLLVDRQNVSLPPTR